MGALLVALLSASPALPQGECDVDGDAIEVLSVDYPHGATRLVVWRNGEAALFYGALPRHGTVARGIFDVEALHERLRPRLHPNGPREAWPDPKAEAGMVQLGLEDGTGRSCLIFDEGAFVERLFDEARENIVEGDPLPR